MRELTDHKVNPANDTLTVTVVDEPGSGGANHAYFISGANFDANPGSSAALEYAKAADAEGCVVLFQNGPINEAGVNGLTHEVLLAIVADRLRSFQQGPFASRYNALALTHIEDAQNWLNRRTLERMRRGVEGTNKA